MGTMAFRRTYPTRPPRSPSREAPGPAENAVKQVVGPQAGEDKVLLPLRAAQDFDYRGFGIIVDKLGGHAAQPFKGQPVAF